MLIQRLKDKFEKQSQSRNNNNTSTSRRLFHHHLDRELTQLPDEGKPVARPGTSSITTTFECLVASVAWRTQCRGRLCLSCQLKP